MKLSSAEMAYARRLLWHYKHLDEEWLRKQNSKGIYSNMKLSFVKNSPWRASVHNLFPKQKEHLPENCVLEILEMNVQQHSAIPDLFGAYRQLWSAMVNLPSSTDVRRNILHFKKNFARTPGQNGVCSRSLGLQYWTDMRHLHLKHILRKSVCNHLKKDNTVFEESNKWYLSQEEKSLLVQACMEKLCNVQKTRCHYSKTLLSFGNNWAKISIERIDNKKPHFLPGLDLSNVMFVCRILNSAAGWNRKKLLTVFLTQKEVCIPDGLRASYIKELQSMDLDPGTSN